MLLQNKVLNEDIDFANIQNASLRQLLQRILEKDPTKRATLQEMLSNPWVTANGTQKI